jgi:hypothetical protein
MNPKQKEQQLNQTLSECYTSDEALDRFIYLTSNRRKARTTEANILKCHRNHQLGTLLRRLDPIAFNCE